MVDYSFIRFETSLEKAMDIGSPRVSTIHYNDQIHLIPNELYCQISNTSFGIIFSDMFEAYLVDCGDNVIAEITENVAITEFIDKRGINQIAIEFFLTEDYGITPLYLKLVATKSSDVYYSNAFVCSDSLSEQTSFFCYRNYGYFEGISYDKFTGFQAIRLAFYYDYPTNETEVGEYYQITTKNTISNRALYKQSEKYSNTGINSFVYERANIMLIHDVVYVDNVRITNKPQCVSEERIMSTNIFTSSFDCYKDRNDTFEYKVQIFEDIDLIETQPKGLYQNNAKPTSLKMVFNQDIISYQDVEITLYKYDNDAVVQVFTSQDLTVTADEITANLPSIDNSTKYYFLVSAGIKGLLTEFIGIFDKEIWNFRTAQGDFSPDDFDSTDFFTTI